MVSFVADTDVWSFQNCDPDDDEPMVTYHCPPENFTNDCNAYEGIGSSTGFGYTGKRAESITFVPGNSNQILFTEWDGDDASIPAKMVLYDWYSKVRECWSKRLQCFMTTILQMTDWYVPKNWGQSFTFI